MKRDHILNFSEGHGLFPLNHSGLLNFFRVSLSTNTLETQTYSDWLTRNGEVSHEVTLLKTPKVKVSWTLFFSVLSQ